MLVPMFGLLFGLLFILPAALLVLGGLVALAVVGDKYASKWVPVTFAAFFAGLGYWAVLVVSGVLLGTLLMKGFTLVVLPLMLLAAFAGGFGGSVYGYRLGLARRRRYARFGG